MVGDDTHTEDALGSHDIISGTEAAYWYTTNSARVQVEPKPKLHNPDMFWEKVNDIQKKMQELIVNFEELKAMKKDVVGTNKNRDQ
ncbi:MAG: hypothetical protein Unbinned6046contig1000_20 [Prokaryotic dsDNA virus sp.]|nr:MAG: hypothetical protein Unbinned6046contig1000_20 [Prokaryotic dsDNA virus sp.]|tara:strand:+ start:4732 stop:4989 length:258 start_codon:yes stop_codon:yes gene_type:complete